MELNNYLSQMNSMRSANIGFKPPPVVDDIVNDRAVVGKNALEGISGTLVGGATLNSIKALTKSKALSKVGIEAQDVDAVVSSANEGDLSGMASNTSRAIIRAGNRALQRGVQQGRNLVSRLGTSATKNISEPPPISALYDRAIENEPKAPPTQSASEPPEVEADAPLSEVQANQEYAQNVRSGVQDILKGGEDNPFSAPKGLSTQVTSTAENIGADISKGEKIVKGLKEGAEISEAADFDPADVAVTAVLGLAGVIGGLFVKTHHVNYIKPPATNPTNYGAQLF